MTSAGHTSNWVVMGRITGLYGVHGWVKVFSYTEPRDGIVDYDPLYLDQRGEWQSCSLEEGRNHGRGLIIKFAGYDDRNSASWLLGKNIAVRREQLPQPEPGEFYWADLQGMRVVNLEGMDFGVVDHVFATGANDVLVVKGDRQRLLPFIRPDVIIGIDPADRLIRVDWDADF